MFTQLIDRTTWWIVRYIIPFLNLIIWILGSIEMAKRFGKDAG